jgi:hypothetical protein
MNPRSPRKFFTSCLAFLVLISVSGCTQKVVVLTPTDDDLVILNGCVISACNYLAVVKTQHTLEPDFWAKILLVRYANHPAGHAYCIWETDGTIYGYDRNAGSFTIPVYTRDARAGTFKDHGGATGGSARGICRAKIRSLSLLSGSRVHSGKFR